MERKCLECGKLIYTTEYRVGRGESKYCSRECAFKSKISSRLRSISKMGEQNPNWKGATVGRTGLHAWVVRHLPKPRVCNNCQKENGLELHNKNGKYNRNLREWVWLCRKCHMIIDGRLAKLNEKNTT